MIFTNHEAARPQPEPGITAAVALEQRPWVSLDVELAEGLNYDNKDFQGGVWPHGVRYRGLLRYKIKNTGKTPATQIDVFAQFMPFIVPHLPPEAFKDGVPLGLPIPGTDINSEMERLFDAEDQMAKSGMAGTAGMLAQGEERIAFLGLNGDSPLFKNAQAPKSGYIGFFVVLVYCTVQPSTRSGTEWARFLIFKKEPEHKK